MRIKEVELFYLLFVFPDLFHNFFVAKIHIKLDMFIESNLNIQNIDEDTS